MRWILTPETKAGMVLGESVKDAHGRTLAERGESVSGKLIALFENAGVKEILAEDAGTGADLPDGAEAVRQRQITEVTDAVRQKLEIRFRKFKEKPIMQTVRSLAEKKLIAAEVSKLPRQP